MALAEVAELKSPVKSWVPSKKQLLIGGKWVDAKSGKTFDVENPALEILSHKLQMVKKKISMKRLKLQEKLLNQVRGKT